MATQANLRLPVLNPKQKEFIRARTRFVGYGGARGGGKSFILRWKSVMLAIQNDGINILVIRRTMPELRKNFTQPMQTLLNGIANYRELTKEFIFPNGSIIQLGYCDSDRDALHYQGLEFDIIFIDEATQIEEQWWEWIKMSLRTTKEGIPHRIYVTCNPGGVGHAWVKRLFIDRDYRAGEDGGDYTFIQAKATDNRELCRKDPGYLKMLDSLPDGIREAWRDGNWDVYDGQFFPEFRRDLHTCEVPQVLPPKWWRRYVTIDYGLDMLAGLWVAVSPTGQCVVYRELYKPNMRVSDAAEEILRLSADEDISDYLAPPDLWHRHSDSGQSTADIFGSFGLWLTQTSNDRIAGWRQLKEMLKPNADGVCPLMIYRNCVNLVRCIPLLQHDDKKVEDVSTTPHEITHAPDALRGFCIFRYMTAKEPGGRPPKIPFKFLKPSVSDNGEAYGYGERVSPI